MQTISVGAAANDGTGDTFRTAFQKVNFNFAEVQSGYQPLDADLTALAALAGTGSMYYRLEAGVWSPVSVGTGLSFTGGTLTATGGDLSAYAKLAGPQTHTGAHRFSGTLRATGFSVGTASADFTILDLSESGDLTLSGNLNAGGNIAGSAIRSRYFGDPTNSTPYLDFDSSARAVTARPRLANQSPIAVDGLSGQTAPLLPLSVNGGSVGGFLSGGEWRPPHRSDAAADTDCVYYSTTAGVLVYKDAGGSVHTLY